MPGASKGDGQLPKAARDNQHKKNANYRTQLYYLPTWY